ncbi:hypothetical protein AGLY_005606 [Aphis glycines]|uniref:Uncharacterized protein n=1 Tax=Aphis glycines TaxID=307491 RepID=A0A6G0TVM2_APHGL|nr:hypothetical protein AGLY_005606 [Aphis glycines]
MLKKNIEMNYNSIGFSLYSTHGYILILHHNRDLWRVKRDNRDQSHKLETCSGVPGLSKCSYLYIDQKHANSTNDNHEEIKNAWHQETNVFTSSLGYWNRSYCKKKSKERPYMVLARPGVGKNIKIKINISITVNYLMRKIAFLFLSFLKSGTRGEQLMRNVSSSYISLFFVWENVKAIATIFRLFSKNSECFFASSVSTFFRNVFISSLMFQKRSTTRPLLSQRTLLCCSKSE